MKTGIKSDLRNIRPAAGGIRLRAGFTLVELMTVIVLIAIMSTLLLSALMNVKKRAHVAKCSSNLRQISMAVRMYLDDESKAPRGLVHLNRSGYLPMPGVLTCPSDKIGNWGELISEGPTLTTLIGADALPEPPGMEGAASKHDSYYTPPKPVPFSYLHPFHLRPRTWDALMEYGRKDAGVVACQLHGVRQDSHADPSVYAFSGLVLRGNASGSVVSRQLFWNQDDKARIQPGNAFLEANLTPAAIDQSLWKFFSDSPVPTPSMAPRKTLVTLVDRVPNPSL